MRTTVRLDDEVLEAAKELAAKTGRTLTDLIEDSLRDALARAQQPGPAHPVSLTTSPGGPRPGMNLDRTADLLDVMDAR